MGTRTWERRFEETWTNSWCPGPKDNVDSAADDDDGAEASDDYFVGRDISIHKISKSEMQWSRVKPGFRKLMRKHKILHESISCKLGKDGAADDCKKVNANPFKCRWNHPRSLSTRKISFWSVLSQHQLKVWSFPPGVRPGRPDRGWQAGGDQMPAQVLLCLHGNTCQVAPSSKLDRSFRFYGMNIAKTYFDSLNYNLDWRTCCRYNLRFNQTFQGRQ